MEDGLEESKGGSKKASEEIVTLSRKEGMVAENSGGREDRMRRWDSGCGWGQQPGRVVGWGLWGRNQDGLWGYVYHAISMSCPVLVFGDGSLESDARSRLEI